MRLSALLLFFVPLVMATDYYKLLGISKTATDREIKSAYRRLSKKWHPDKNPGNPEASQKFVELGEAYSALSNEETRRIYDQYGLEGLKQHQSGGGGGRGGDPFDIFSRFFGGGGHFGHGQRQGPNMEVRLKVPLRDFYTGKEINFSVEKQQICEVCEGSGSHDGKHETCNVCKGRGMKLVKHMLAPGIFQQVQSVCDRCGGQGKIISHPCEVCHGKRVVRKAEEHTLHLERGSPRNIQVPFENEADESPDWVAGNLIVQVEEQSPEDAIKNLDSEDDTGATDGFFFRRRGNDLFWKEALSLREALLGDWERNITHLDGHVVKLSRKKGEVVQPGFVEVIEGEGMPVWQSDHDEFGDLLVEYMVVLPDKAEKGFYKEVRGIFDKYRKKAPKKWHDEL